MGVKCVCVLTVWVVGELHLNETVVVSICARVSQNSVHESTYVGVCLGIPGLMKLELVCVCVCV